MHHTTCDVTVAERQTRNFLQNNRRHTCFVFLTNFCGSFPMTASKVAILCSKSATCEFIKHINLLTLEIRRNISFEGHREDMEGKQNVENWRNLVQSSIEKTNKSTKNKVIIHNQRIKCLQKGDSDLFSRLFTPFLLPYQIFCLTAFYNLEKLPECLGMDLTEKNRDLVAYRQASKYLFGLQGLFWTNSIKSSPLVYILPLTYILQRGYLVKFGGESPLAPLYFEPCLTYK